MLLNSYPRGFFSRGTSRQNGDGDDGNDLCDGFPWLSKPVVAVQ